MMPVSVKYGEKYHCVINPDVSRGYKTYGMMSKNDGNFTTFVNKKSSFESENIKTKFVGLSVAVLLFVCCLLFGGRAFAETLTVYDGTATNGFVPVYGFYADAYLKAEFVYPASELSDMAGGRISAMKFYASQSSVSWGSANFKVYLKEIASTSISSFDASDGTLVYDGALSIANGEMSVVFSSSFEYDNGNLLVGIYNSATGSYVTSTWYGETVNGASVQGYSYSGLSSVSPTQRDFLPKTTFTYTLSVTAPTVTTSGTFTYNISSLTATLGGSITNMGNANTVTAGICMGTTNPPTTSNSTHQESNYIGTGSFSKTFNNLTSGTTYYYRAFAYNSANSLSSPSYGTTYYFIMPKEFDVGSNQSSNNYLPTYILYNYSLTQQI